jgi:CDP-diacylglycerol--serine O-phosphatidyltransferase
MVSAWNRVSPADLFTLANGALGFVAITYILDREFIAASGLLLLSMIMDGLDGYMARRFGSRHGKGQVLDSISDSISFVFAPALLVYAELHGPDKSALENMVVLIASISFLATGLFRLARFSAGGYQLGYFVGMPAPAGALVIILLCLLFGASSGLESAGYYFTFTQLPSLILFTTFAVSFLMASEIPYPKMHDRMALAGGTGLLLAVLPYAAGLAIVNDQRLYTAFSRTATSIALALTLVYVLGGPLYERHEGARSR